MSLYIDANIFLNAALYTDEKAQKCRKLLENIALGKESACTATLTWDEVVFILRKKMSIEESIVKGRNFLEIKNLTLIEVSKHTLVVAQDLMQKHSLKPRDAIHAATAIINKCEEFISDDADFDKVKELKRRKI